jgi:hypothetical protein
VHAVKDDLRAQANKSKIALVPLGHQQDTTRRKSAESLHVHMCKWV